MRDDLWLIGKLDFLWSIFFTDIEKRNEVKIVFKGKWKNKFAHIKKKKDHTEIAINGLFRNEKVPDYIVELAIAHELAHYMHGFQSPYERKFKYPHKGGVVNKELKYRGFSSYIKNEKKWIREEWFKLYEKLINK